MFEREKLSGNNFNDWFRQLKLVLRVKKKRFVIDQPLPLAPAVDSDAQVQYDCLGLPTWPAVMSEEPRWSSRRGRACGVGFREARKVKQGALYLYVGNGVRAQVEAIGCFDLVLPNGLVICLDNCHYAPSITRGVVSKRIEKMQQEGLLKSADDESFDQCVSCLSGKMTRKSFPHRPEMANDLFGIIHIDVCGPLRHVSRQGASYFITIMDDYSHQGGEYISQEFKDYLKACGIVQQLTPPYTPQLNGVSERRKRTLLDMSATRILNMVPTKKVDKTSYELWYGKVPNLSYLKVWGCKALVKRDTPEKLQQRPVKCIFIGYPKETMGYYFYFPPENKIVVARLVAKQEKEDIDALAKPVTKSQDGHYH
ncbi:retrotransposon protein, putative, ty1-copia subclass [Tanacetum coccineum]